MIKLFILTYFVVCKGQFSNSRLAGVGIRKVPPSCKTLNTPGKEYLMEQNSKRCYQIGSRGPCGELMTFYKNPLPQFQLQNQYGFCDCDQGFADEHMPCKDSPIRRRVYIERDKRCYTVFSQGPCKSGEWLVLNETRDEATCVPNKCIHLGKSRDTDDQFWFYDPQRRKCFQTFTKGHCPSGMHLELVHDSQYPRCKVPTCLGSLAYGIRLTVTCQAGTRFSALTNSCKRSARRLLGIG